MIAVVTLAVTLSVANDVLYTPFAAVNAIVFALNWLRKTASLAVPALCANWADSDPWLTLKKSISAADASAVALACAIVAVVSDIFAAVDAANDCTTGPPILAAKTADTANRACIAAA